MSLFRRECEPMFPKANEKSTLMTASVLILTPRINGFLLETTICAPDSPDNRRYLSGVRECCCCAVQQSGSATAQMMKQSNLHLRDRLGF